VVEFQNTLREIKTQRDESIHILDEPRSGAKIPNTQRGELKIRELKARGLNGSGGGHRLSESTSSRQDTGQQLELRSQMSKKEEDKILLVGDISEVCSIW
jgi:hypothetical protein